MGGEVVPTLIFDLDGTIVDSRNSILESIRYGLKTINRTEWVDEVQAVRQDLWTTLRETGEKYGTTFSEEEKLTFIRHYREHHHRNASQTMQPYERVDEVLKELKSTFKLAVATTKHTEQAKHILSEFGLDIHFDWIQGTDSGLRYKPAPDILFKTLKELGRGPGTAVYIGDSPHDMQAARNAAMMSAGAIYGFSNFEELAEHSPHWILDSFEDLLKFRPQFLSAMIMSERELGSA